MRKDHSPRLPWSRRKTIRLKYYRVTPNLIGDSLMRLKNKGKKAKAVSNKAFIASITNEMAQPRMTESARLKADKPIEPCDGKRV
jgi:hypothetical protein